MIGRQRERQQLADRVLGVIGARGQLGQEIRHGPGEPGRGGPVAAGNSGPNFSFMSYNFSNKYIRHFNFLAYIASDGGSNAWDAAGLWPNDTTWAVAAPWA